MPQQDHLTALAGRTAAPLPRRHRTDLTDRGELTALAVCLANTRWDDTTQMCAAVTRWPGLGDGLTSTGLAVLGAAGRQLRAVFVDAAAGRDREAVGRLNRLLTRHRLRPVISGTGPSDRHLHVAAVGSDPAVEYVAAAVWALAVFLCEQGVDRFKVCAEPGCGAVFLDGSTNRRRRFCSPRCATRTHVRAHRARRRVT
ncbi:CGNR zinc finger domain-containing protein [Micromonospora sp. WMMD754]|uniref:CGNR zinc finger domain-containing protein n=1 Tax=Micromonospora sp. WMMD754 TaxID=3404114 RepID=UPI003BF4CBE4